MITPLAHIARGAVGLSVCGVFGWALADAISRFGAYVDKPPPPPDPMAVFLKLYPHTRIITRSD